ncbi:hypothetical protein [Streptomyces sp. NPDC058953]|uniref:hypothetical protein n=1 Tax=Streptomyces sp. NPDC058953 TaxID=3346676 RepID=UPI0036A6BC62
MSDDYYDLGTHTRRVTTSSPVAQLWFDRGLVWTYAFHHEEAVRCFEKAAEADPDCAMAYWGIAYALGPNYNKPWEFFDARDLARTVERTHAAVERAREKAAGATVAERALIAALRARYPRATPVEDCSVWNEPYAESMRAAYASDPGDLDVAALYADALMNLTPWRLWDVRTGEPAAGARTVEAKAVLERALAAAGGRDHPGVVHLYIHLMEMSPYPERALPVADRLRGLVPDAGHLAHMPSHLEVLCGDYRRVVWDNDAAIAVDAKVLDRAGAMNFYTLYRCHNIHFKIYGAMFLGQSEVALKAVEQLEAAVPEQLLRVQSPPMADWLEAFSAMRVHALIRFGRWSDVLGLPFPHDPELYSTTTAMLHYARGVALSATGRVSEAETERERFREAAGRVQETRMLFNNTCADILTIAAAMLDGELEYRHGNVDVAFAALRRSIELSDSLPYDEPWGWMQPPRHAYGALLLEQGRVVAGPGRASAGAGPPRARPPAPRPPPPADRAPGAGDTGQHDMVRTEPGMDQHTPPQPHPIQIPLPGPAADGAPTGRRRARRPEGGDDTSGHGQPLAPEAPGVPGAPGDGAVPASHPHSTGSLSLPLPPAEPVTPMGPVPPVPPAPAPAVPVHGTPAQGVPAQPGDTGQGRTGAQPLPAETSPVAGGAPLPADASQGRAFSVRALGQAVAAPRTAAAPGPVPAQPQGSGSGSAGSGSSSGSGRRRKLGTPPTADRPETEADTGTEAQAQVQASAVAPGGTGAPGAPPVTSVPSGLDREGEAPGRAYAISAPDAGAEGPEPLDGAFEVDNRPPPQPVDDELPPEPLDNPRRLLVWPAPDVSTQQALSERGYRPVVVHSREEVDAQIAAFPAALFVDPLTGPITRTALQSLRQAAVAAEVPVLVTAGLGQATREAAYGADPAVLLKALAPRDSDQHPSRVLLIEEHEEIALALTDALERRGLQVARAAADADAVTLATRMRPNLVVMDLMQVRRRRAGIIDWLRANGRLNRTPLVVYTSAGLNRPELPRLSSGETVLFLAERSTSAEVQSRIVDLLAKIGTN